MPQEEGFSNPVAPPGEPAPEESRGSHKLTNADFRRLMMTPRAAPGTAPAKEGTEAGAGSGGKAGAGEESKTGGGTGSAQQRKDPKEEARASERKKKKSYYARIKKEDEQKMAELAEKYRDRARERRDGSNPDYQADEASTTATGAAAAAAAAGDGQGAYRAVAPDLKSGMDAAERRKQMIQESKFLGGDMEHTHLVKGLDYALLQKVRSEITLKETVEEAAAAGAAGGGEAAGSGDEGKDEDEKMQFKTALGRRVFNAIMSGRSGPEFNDLFLPGRMAYSIDLEADDEIPTTNVRSKADLQGIENMQATFTSNDLVIQKLSQILSYLRTGRTSKKTKKKTDVKKTEAGKGGVDDSIYGELGEYAPSVNKNSHRDPNATALRPRDTHRDRDKDRGERGGRGRDSYFNKASSGRGDDAGPDAALRLDISDVWGGTEPTNTSGGAGDRANGAAGAGAGGQDAAANVRLQQNRSETTATAGNKQQQQHKASEQQFYTECYPDMAEMHDAIDDSDDEADYTKMDLGNKKGPIGRWDFDTTEEYSDYMNQKEALPKAAFQYGVKMADGRKTRRLPGERTREKDRNAELSREWQQIQAILKKRKDGEPLIAPTPEKRGKYEY